MAKYRGFFLGLLGLLALSFGLSLKPEPASAYQFCGLFNFPCWTTSTRPFSASGIGAGTTGYNMTTQTIEWWNGSTWVQPSGGGGANCSSFSGDVTGNSSCVLTIGLGAVTFSKMQTIGANSIMGNNTGSSAAPTNLSQAQVTAMLNVFNSSLQGVVPASGGGTANFLRADGQWQQPPSGNVLLGSSTITGGSGSTNILYDNSGVFAEKSFVLLCTNFSTSTTAPGCVPGSNGAAATTFLNATGTWTTPSGGGGITIGSTTITSGTNTRVLYDNSGVVGEYTAVQLTAQCQAFSTSTTTSGCVAGSNGASTSNFLRADNTWAVPPSGGTLTIGSTSISGGTVGQILTVGTGPTLAQGTFSSLCTTFSTSTTTPGCVPGSNSAGATSFLNATGAWSVPAGSGTPGLPVNAVQYNTGPGTFTGSSGLTFVTSPVSTLTLGAGQAVFNLNGTLNLEPTASSLQQAEVQIQTVSGTVPSGNCATVSGQTSCAYTGTLWQITTDNANVQANASPHNLANGVGWQFVHQYGGAALTGSRTSVVIDSFLNAATTTSNANSQYVGLGVVQFTNVNLGGTGLGATTAYGSTTGADIIAGLNNGASNVFGVTGVEVDFGIQTGANARYKVGLAIMHGQTPGNDNVAGVAVDAQLLLAANGTGNVGSQVGIQFGVPNNLFNGCTVCASPPVATTGNLMYVAQSMTVAYGLNFLNASFSTALLASPNTTIDGGGDIATGGYVSAGTFLQAASGAALSSPTTTAYTCGGSFGCTAGSIPACNSARYGSISMIRDSQVPTFGSGATGGSSIQTVVVCNGNVWAWL